MSDQTPRATGDVSRREAIKKAMVGGATAAAVWNAPKIDGLAIRPVYAAAQSAPSLDEVACVTFDGNESFNNATVVTVTINGIAQPSPAVSGGAVIIPICGGGRIRVAYSNNPFNQGINGDIRPQGAGGGAGTATSVTASANLPTPLNSSGAGSSQINFGGNASINPPPTPGEIKLTFEYTCGTP